MATDASAAPADVEPDYVASLGDTGDWVLAHPVGCPCLGCRVIRRLGPALAAPAWPRLAASASPPGALPPATARAHADYQRRRARAKQAERAAGTLTPRQRRTRIAVPWA